MSLAFNLRLCAALFFGKYMLSLPLLGTTFSLAWPTPNPSFAQGLGYHTFLQKTGPDKDFSSGAFGCVRNHGSKFHEGLDLFPLRVNSRGVAQDSIFAALKGRIVHISTLASDSAYGKYIVLEHEEFEPVLYSLYAHLDSINEGLKIGGPVEVAQEIGKMGNTASFHIPLNRSHLHFEVGIRLSEKFDIWYNRQKFKTKNKHHNFNGYNLVGLDPIKFYREYQKSPFASPAEYLTTLPLITKIQVSHSRAPFLAQRNPSMTSTLVSNQPVKSWICSFGPFGFPLKFEKSSLVLNEPIRILSYDENLDSDLCRKLILKRNGKLYPSEQLEAYLELIFLD